MLKYVPTAEKREALRMLQGPQTNQVLLFAEKSNLGEGAVTEIAKDIEKVSELNPTR